MKKNSHLAKKIKPLLVVVMNNKRDFEILQKEKWYRVPIKRAPKLLRSLEPKYLAFYQTRIFGEQGQKINYFAKIKKFEIVRRKELLPKEKNHPRASDDYFKIQINRLQKLKFPLARRRWRRIVFIPTYLERLFKAKKIEDLTKKAKLFF